MNDYMILASVMLWLTGANTLALIPVAAIALTYPRKITIFHYFTYYAELLPHTEQVAFHKVTFFGKQKRIIVDIKNLEKIDAAAVPSKHLFKITIFD